MEEKYDGSENTQTVFLPYCFVKKATVNSREWYIMAHRRASTSNNSLYQWKLLCVQMDNAFLMLCFVYHHSDPPRSHLTLKLEPFLITHLILQSQRAGA